MKQTERDALARHLDQHIRKLLKPLQDEIAELREQLNQKSAEGFVIREFMRPDPPAPRLPTAEECMRQLG